jgi:hypothetical protein
VNKKRGGKVTQEEVKVGNIDKEVTMIIKKYIGICNRKKVMLNGNKNIQGFIQKQKSKCYRRGDQLGEKNPICNRHQK